MRALVCLVIVFFAALSALAEEVPAQPTVPPVSMDICKYTINGRNLTLSKSTPQTTETCINIGHGLRYTMLSHVYTGVSRLAASIARFAVPNPNATLACTVNLVEQSMPLPLVENEAECSYWQRHVSFLAEEAVYGQLDTLRRAMGLSSDDADSEGPHQSVSLTPKAPCEFGPYGLSMAHWIKTDCDLARALYAKCLSKRTDADMRASVFYCFTQAVAQTDDIADVPRLGA